MVVIGSFDCLLLQYCLVFDPVGYSDHLKRKMIVSMKKSWTFLMKLEIRILGKMNGRRTVSQLV